MSSRGIRGHDNFSLEQRLRKLRPTMLNFARKLCGQYGLPEHMADDLTQLAWLGAYRCYSAVEKPECFQTWVLAIVKNKVLDARRKCRDEELDEGVAELVLDETPNAGESFERYQEAVRLHTAIAQLSPDHRQTINLVYFHEHSLEETAAIMGTNLNTVKTRAHYARKQLRELLATELAA